MPTRLISLADKITIIKTPTIWDKVKKKAKFEMTILVYPFSIVSAMKA